MPRYKGRASPKAIEKDFPHIVEMRVPLGGFGSKLNAMHRWHEARGIRAIHSTGRRDENNRDIIRGALPILSRQKSLPRRSPT